MPITALSTPPSRNDPANFATRADTFLAELPTFAAEANILQADVNAKQTAAAASQVAAAASQAAAEAASTASIWVSGTTYAIGNVRFSPINFKSYRRKTAGAGTTDPSADSTNWQLLTGLGDVDLSSTQTLTNKTHSTGSVWNGTAVPVANGGTGATTAANARSNLGTNDASNLDSGTVATARLGSGTADSNAYLAGDGTWKVFSTEMFNDIAAGSLGAVGTYAYLARSPVATVTEGNTESGSNLRYAGHFIDGSANTNGVTGGTPSGTWRAMGRTQGAGVWTATLWLRIA